MTWWPADGFQCQTAFCHASQLVCDWWTAVSYFYPCYKYTKADHFHRNHGNHVLVDLYGEKLFLITKWLIIAHDLCIAMESSEMMFYAKLSSLTVASHSWQHNLTIEYHRMLTTQSMMYKISNFWRPTFDSCLPWKHRSHQFRAKTVCTEIHKQLVKLICRLSDKTIVTHQL